MATFPAAAFGIGFLKGQGLETLWPEALALLAFGVAFLTLASLRFKKRLD